MAQNTDLRKIEKKVWTSYFEDGLLEIALGVIMLVAVLSSTMDAIGVSDEVRISIYIPLMVIVPALIVLLGKRYITMPRLGVAKFGPRWMRRSLIMFVGLICVQLVLLAMLFLKWFYTVGPAWLGSAIVTLNIFVAFCLIAYLLKNRRMYVVGVLFAMSEPVWFYLSNYSNTVYNGLIAYGIPAIMVIAMGSITLRRFIRKYELPTKETPDAN